MRPPVNENKAVVNKRRFQRIEVNAAVDVFSTLKTLLGKGELVDVSASGIKFKTQITKGIVRFGEIMVSFKLSDSLEIVKAKGEVKLLTNLPEGSLVSLKFEEPRIVYLLKPYVENKTTVKEGSGG